MPGYSDRVYEYVKGALNKDVISGEGEISRELKREISKTFQRANRRIQNVRAAGGYSPAVAALGEISSGFTVFSTKGKDWTQLRREYARAVQFMQSPTSTATGAREYRRGLQDKYGLTDEAVELIDRASGNELSGIRQVDLLLRNYKEIAADYEQSYRDEAEQIEQKAIELETANREAVQTAIDDVSSDVGDVFTPLDDYAPF